MSENRIRKLTAPVSLVMCVLIILVSFYHFYGQEYEGPIIFNSKFKYFTKDPQSNGTKPYLWESTYFSGPNDEIFVSQDIVDNHLCLGMHIYQDGVNDTYDWATIHIKQRIRGNSLVKVLDGKFGVWVYPTFTYIFDETTKDPRNVFGIEINDGENMIWFVFSNSANQTHQLRNHRIVVVDTPLNRWSYREIDISEQYREANWELPKDISFILITGATKGTRAHYSAYFREIIVK